MGWECSNSNLLLCVLEKGELGLEFLNSLGGIKYMSNGFELSTCELNFAMIVST